ncbi:MAG: serine/threonine protein kinase, partial [Microbacterium sp.]|nr:serine/threonine protein kinase [Microbacterium sp.]
MASRLPSAPPGLAGFTYVRPLGTGGFADVFLFEQNLPRRPVAVKVLLEDIVDESLLRMFNAEADVMARLSSHPSILTIYEASISSDGRPYIVMEYCPTSLTNRYRREVIPVAEVLQLGVKIGSALETAHRSGLLHRDIKPSNILITTFGTPVLSDFGIAAAISGRSDGDEVFAMSVPWSAPEIIDERVSGSVAAEVWGLGATLYSLLAGRSPFERAGSGQNSRDQL